MPGIAVQIGDIVVPNGVLIGKLKIALAGIGDRVALRIEDAVHELASPHQALGHEPRMHIALAHARADGGQHRGVGIIQNIGGTFEQRDLAWCFDRAHLVHHGRAVDHAQFRQASPQALPVRSAEEVALEADDCVGEAHLGDDGCKPLDRRLPISLVHLDELYPGVAACKAFSEGIEHNSRFSLPRPDHKRTAWGIRQVEVPRQCSGVGDTGEVCVVHAGPRDDCRQAMLVQLLIEPIEIDQDLT